MQEPDSDETQRCVCFPLLSLLLVGLYPNINTSRSTHLNDLMLSLVTTFDMKEKMSAEEETRAVVEGRFLSMRAHARELGVGQPSRILATGGGSNNVEVSDSLNHAVRSCSRLWWRLEEGRAERQGEAEQIEAEQSVAKQSKTKKRKA